MRKTYELDRTYLFLLPVLALGLGACPSDENISASASEGESESESESDDEDSDSVDPSNDPSPSAPTEADDTTSTTDTPTEPPGPTTEITTEETLTTVDTEPTPTTIDTESDTDTDTDTSTGEPAEELVAVWGSVNPGGIAGDALVGLTPALDALAPTLTIETDVLSIQSVAINTGNDAAITYDAPGGVGGVIIDENLSQNPMSGPLGLGDRVVVGPSTGLTAPKGVEWLNLDTFLVADTGTGSMKAFNFTDEGDVAPTFEVVDLGTSGAVWDMHYVSASDTLYAAGTNGEVQVYEDFLMLMGAAGPDRTITPTEGGNPIAVNLHGISILNGTLYLTDVGDPANTEDGQLFLIANAADADGMTDVQERVSGGMLGNPVDLEVRSGGVSERVFVAEKSNKALLVFSRTLAINPLGQTAMLAIDAPESVALVGNGNALFVGRNAASLDGDAVLAVNAPGIGNPNVTQTMDRLGSVTSIQSVALNHAGDAWIGFDGAPSSGGGGVFQIPALTGIADDGVRSAVDARLWGPSTKIVAPKGMTLSADGSALILADFGDGDIKVFDPSATGDVAPTFTVGDVGGEVPWDVVYDDAQDRLFVAGTNGSVLVYDGFLADGGASGPARFIVPSYNDGASDSVNLHGIAYDAATDTLLVSDVGDPMAADDGLLFIIADASTAQDVTEVKAVIGGDQTGLGNPVDVAFDGVNLYVAEKSNSKVLRFDGVLDLAGVVNEPAAAAIDVVNAESVQLFFAVP